MIARVPAAPALFVGVLLGALTAVVFNRTSSVKSQAQTSDSLLRRTWLHAGDGARCGDCDGPRYDELLSSSGMAGMLNTVWLIVCAMTFGLSSRPQACWPA